MVNVLLLTNRPDIEWGLRFILARKDLELTVQYFTGQINIEPDQADAVIVHLVDKFGLDAVIDCRSSAPQIPVIALAETRSLVYHAHGLGAVWGVLVSEMSHRNYLLTVINTLTKRPKAVSSGQHEENGDG